jgi:outer membrane receptor for ferrienterochelin and colicins
MRLFIYFIFGLFISASSFAQLVETKDSSRTLEEVVITSTRTETKLSNVAVPVKIISQISIQQSGQLRLRDVLTEQAGLYITNGFGAGVQMQGLNPDYTLILLNGEPLVGRTAGVLDLNRISVSNIKKIEIVKGPSSSLYGSEAMAGVINIITDQTASKSIETGIRYGFGNSEKGWIAPVGKDVFKNIDYNLNLKTIIGKTSLQLSSNIYYLDGISYRPHSTATIAQPIYRTTNQLNLSRKLSSKLGFNLSMRNGYDYIKQEFAVTNNGAIINSFGREANNDFNVNPTLTYRINKNTSSFLKLYTTIYSGSQRLNFSDKPDSVYNDEFKQHFYRVENQTDFNHNTYRVSIGAGYTIDQANSTRYDRVENNKTNQIFYGFAQHEWNPTNKLFIISGVRYDHNQLFAAAFSPKIAIRYNPGKSIGF